MDDTRTVTLLLERLRGGDEAAGDELLPLVRTDLHRLAERAMAGQRRDHTLQPTALVHEAWLKVASAGGTVNDRAHFIALAARAMRTVLVDHARRRNADKRAGGARRSSLDGIAVELEERAVDLLALDEALRGLAQADAHLARVVELRFFGGLEHAEIAALVGRSVRSIERDWAAARHFLRQRVDPEEA